MKIKNNLKSIREEHKYTQAEVAKILGISQRAVSKYEYAERIYYDTAVMFSKFYDEPVNKLFPEL